MSGKITLSCERYEGEETVRMTVSDEINLDDLLFQFDCFVRAMGYFPKGPAEINDEEYFQKLEMEHHYPRLVKENKKLAKKLKKLCKLMEEGEI